jgi:hypothetical protein
MLFKKKLQKKNIKKKNTKKNVFYQDGRTDRQPRVHLKTIVRSLTKIFFVYEQIINRQELLTATSGCQIQLTFVLAISKKITDQIIILSFLNSA